MLVTVSQCHDQNLYTDILIDPIKYAKICADGNFTYEQIIGDKSMRRMPPKWLEVMKAELDRLTD